MKILIISRGIPSKKDTMWGNFELDQAKALKSNGHNVVTMSIDRRIRFYWRKIGITQSTIEEIKMYNYFFPLPYRFLPRRIHNHIIDFFAKRLYKTITQLEGDFDIIHGHYLENIRIATTLKKFSSAAVVGTEHWSELKRKKLKRKVRKDAEQTYPYINQLITVSLPLKRIIEEQFHVSSIFVGCVIDNVFEFVPKQNDGIFRFIAVGSLLHIKGFDFLIKAFIKADFGSDVQLHIIGDGPLKQKLQYLISVNGKNEQIFLEGKKSRKEIMNFFSMSSVYVLSSRSENFATASMEALSAGLPVIMTKCGGPEDFVNETNAILVSVDNIDEMSSAMHFIHNNIGNYNPRSISKDIKDKYSAKAIATQLECIYNKVISK